MSFFEKMMRINQAKHTTDFLQAAGRSREADQEGSCETQEVQRLAASSFQEDFGDVPQEPHAQVVYASTKPNLITCLLPKKEQLLREMLARKREFNKKQLAGSGMHRGVELRQRLEESTVQFIKASQEPNNANKVQQINLSLQRVQTAALLKQSKASVLPTPIPADAKKKSLRESIVLDLSHNSTHKQSRASNIQPASQPFSKEIMMRLINLLQNQRHDRRDMVAMSMSLSKQINSHPYPHQPIEKEPPIIINNIMKTPIDALGKDLIEREMKIRMLENHRSKQKNAFHFQAGFTETCDNPLTQRSDITKCNEFNANPIPRNSKVKISLECSRISIQSKKSKQEGEIASKEEVEQTKPCSNFSSQINDQDDHTRMRKPREREQRQQQRQQAFKRPARPKKEEKPLNKVEGKPLPLQTNQENQVLPIAIVSEKVVHKAAVRLDIPLNQGQTQGLTLAEAFKLKIGKLKSEKQRQKTKERSMTEKNDAKLTLIDDNTLLTEAYCQYKTPKEPHLPLSESHNLNYKDSVHSKKTEKPKKKQSTAREDKENSSSKKSREPSKDLIDRLIGGERAKISKKDMYALTRKNYQNLPEIQAKRKEQQKTRQERERLAKIRELQRSTRTLKQVKVTLE